MNIYRSVILAKDREEGQDIEETVYVGIDLSDAVSEIKIFVDRYVKLLVDGKFIEIWRDGKYIDALNCDGKGFNYDN